MRVGAVLLLVTGVFGLAPGVPADPGEVDPDLTQRDADYAAGAEAVAAQNWSGAIFRLLKAERRHPDDANVHNFLGFSYRHLNQFELAFKHYRRAIEIDPRHRGAHEYIGEAYLLIGDLANAERHLKALREICLLPCEELADLEKAVTKYTRKRSKDG